MAFWALAGASALGGLASYFGGEAAADAQSDAASANNATQRYMFDRSTELSEPWRATGINALSEQNALMGLPQVTNAFGEVYTGPSQAERAPDGVLDAWHSNQGGVQSHFGDVNEYLGSHRSNFPTMWENQGQTPTGYADQPGRDTILGADNTVQASGSDNGQDAAYQRFQDGGFARSMLETTQADMDAYMGSFGAGGTAMSGSSLQALNDVNRRNTNNAFTQHWNALGGMSGTGGNVAMTQGQQGLNTASAISANNNQAASAQGSSYMNAANAFNSTLQNGANAYMYGQENGWFG